MSIMAATTSKATRTRVLFDATMPHAAPRTFGRGLLPRPEQYDGRQPFSSEDLRWAAQAFGETTFDFDVEPDWDQLAAEAYATDAAALGLLSPDLGERLASTSLVGHDDVTADSILHRNSDPRWCNCEACVDLRTRRYAR